MSWDAWSEQDTEAVLTLLRTDTTTPMETGRPCDLVGAQTKFAEVARRVGFEVAVFEAPDPSVLDDPIVPVSVRERARELGGAFFSTQPNLVLQLGRGLPERTLMFNFHMDTVSGEVPVGVEGGRITGRGVADAKGLGVAVLAGVRRALQIHRGVEDRLRVVLQSVAGEEGGAMGVYGTRHVERLGYTGRLNVVCEPTAFAAFDRTTASMTACVAVEGVGSTDDAPGAGHNATVLLGYVIGELTREVAPRVAALGGKTCIAGVETGSMHNRVYGSGRLLVNFAYPSLSVGLAIEQIVGDVFDRAVESFAASHAVSVIAGATARAARDIISLTWLKRRLPVLANRDPEMERLLSEAGVERHEEGSGASPFTCDAMWLAGANRYAVVLGPGDLATNGAHTHAEYMDIDDLDRFAWQVCSIVGAFGVRP